MLTCYAAVNAAAWRLDREERRWPRWFAPAGFAGCFVLAFSLPLEAVVTGGIVLLVGMCVFFAIRF